MLDGVSSLGSSIGAYRSLAAGNRRSGTGGQTDSATGETATSSDGATTVALSPQAQQQVQKLKQVDASVRQHEAAHQAASGGHAGGASFTFTRGPDGKNYATAGEVPIDISPESTPSATIAKMEAVKAAALAPSEPSPQDQRVAAQADALTAKAQQELRQQGGSSEAGGASGEKTGESKDASKAGASETGATADSANSASAQGSGTAANRSSDSTGRAGAFSGLSVRGAAAYGSAQALVGSAAIFGAARGASLVV